MIGLKSNFVVLVLNSYSVPVRARRSVTVESVVVTCVFDGVDQILLFRFCGGWFLRAGRKRAPKYSYYRATQDDNLADATEEFKESVSRVCVFTPSVKPRRSSLALTTRNHIRPTNVLRKPAVVNGSGRR